MTADRVILDSRSFERPMAQAPGIESPTMIVSEARRAANRRNAARSTGPKTDEGKAASRRNALKHGLTGSTVDVDDARVVEERSRVIAAEVAEPRWSWQTWIIGEVAGITRRLDRLHAEEGKFQLLVSFRAMASWDADRRLLAENLGARLAGDPPRVVLQLRATPQGCDWLIDRWLVLARLADAEAGWTPEQRRLAFDLLGTPVDVRAESLGEVLDDAGRPTGAIRTDAEIARAEIADLRDQRDEVTEGDEVARTLAENGLAFDASAELRRLRRYESLLHKRLEWCMAQLTPTTPPPTPDLPPRSRPDRDPGAPPAPRPPASSPPPARLSRVATPGDLADVLPPIEPPLPGRPRLDARLEQAEARRAARQRKLDRRRA